MLNFGVTEKKAQALRARMAALGIREADLDERFLTGGGPGGQHVNRSATGVFLTHRPSGTQVKMHQARSQALNRYYARVRLCELVEAATLGDESPAAKRAEKIRKQKARRRRRGRPSSGE